MNESKHTVLCVDDEKNILHALKRILRKEEFRLLTASSGEEGLELLKEEEVHVIISDQRMPEMSGTEFLEKVKEKYPDIIRIILTGYTNVDSITDAINQGNIFKFFLKPWNDQNLKLEIKRALGQYDLVKVNKRLHQQVVERNEELKTLNKNLEGMVQERTRELEIQNQALELSNAVLEDLPIPIIGVSAEGLIVLVNQATLKMGENGTTIDIGRKISSYFSSDVEERIFHVLASNAITKIKGCRLLDLSCDLEISPLLGRFQGKGAVILVESVDD